MGRVASVYGVSVCSRAHPSCKPWTAFRALKEPLRTHQSQTWGILGNLSEVLPLWGFSVSPLLASTRPITWHRLRTTGSGLGCRFILWSNTHFIAQAIMSSSPMTAGAPVFLK